jgi:hypothetical protein
MAYFFRRIHTTKPAMMATRIANATSTSMRGAPELSLVPGLPLSIADGAATTLNCAQAFAGIGCVLVGYAVSPQTVCGPTLVGSTRRDES